MLEKQLMARFEITSSLSCSYFYLASDFIHDAGSYLWYQEAGSDAAKSPLLAPGGVKSRAEHVVIPSGSLPHLLYLLHLQCIDNSSTMPASIRVSRKGSLSVASLFTS